MQPELGHVVMIQADQVLTAMLQMGWQVGNKPPGYAAIQARLRQLFGNGGDGNRMRELREAAIRMATGQPASDDDLGHADLPPLPEEIQQELQAMAIAFEEQLTRLDHRLALCLDSALSDIRSEARIKINTVKRDAEERLAVAHEELDQALTDLQVSGATLSALQEELTNTRELAAKTSGRIEAMEHEQSAKTARISSLENELTTAHAEIATSTGRLETLQSDLQTRIKHIEMLDARLADARESATTAISRAQSLENEMKSGAEQVQCLQDELTSNKESSARNSGRLEVLEQELAAKTGRIIDLEATLTEATTAMATATGRAEVLEQELTAARAHTRKGAKP
ncbi:coiled-coil domain-containing protein [Trichlorobacter lovleyi]|uniref:KfrA N-terminal DNA-binding domain-containing protein n=1 Tax=Trichlorobacter lovleyi (strain ATCC BAA-1151 / DSM 17278 / SZ) TaxID=398767 RepID=B3E8C8_TRIL1|nr:hypothetical protein [Trichlorobacter lovleyi]ACD95165.1 hypothetical protein Glov_1446 [Trichlorobacter lovleyi SZ]